MTIIHQLADGLDMRKGLLTEDPYHSVVDPQRRLGRRTGIGARDTDPRPYALRMG